MSKARQYIISSLSIMFILMLIFTSLLPVAFSEDTDDDLRTVDIVLVLDCSGSMRASDYKDLKLAGAKLAVDMLPIDNARIGVIAFGPKWDKAKGAPYAQYEFQTEDKSVPFGENIALVQSLIAITEDNLSYKETLKKNIFNACSYKHGASYTPIASAVLAAEDMLEAAGSTDYCIILLSDGEDGNYAQSPVRKRAYTLANNPPDGLPKIPLFTISLNYNGNAAGSCFPLLNEDFDEGDNLDVDSEEELSQAVGSVYGRFFEGSTMFPIPREIELGADGMCEVPFVVPVLVSEETIIITGDKLTGVRLFRRDGDSWIEYTKDSGNVIFTVEDEAYRLIKLIRPIDGQWKMILYGEGYANVEYQMIEARELTMNLKIAPVGGTTETDGIYAKNAKFNCIAGFEYAGRTVGSDFFYNEYPAQLILIKPDLTSDMFEMESDGMSYVLHDVTLDEQGEWKIMAFLEDDSLFRGDGRMESNVYTFNVCGSVPKFIGEIEDMELAVGQQSRKFYFDEIIEDADHDIVKINVYGYDSESNRIDMNDVINEDDGGHKFLMFTAPKHDGVWDLTAEITDADGNVCSQSFKMTVINHPPVQIKSISLDEFLGIGKQQVLNLAEYFRDPDGFDMNYEITGSGGEAFEISELSGVISGDSTEVSFVSKKIAKEKITVTVTDSAGSSISADIMLKAASIMQKIGIAAGIIAAVAAVLGIISIIVNRMKSVKGIWSVNVSYNRNSESNNGYLKTAHLKPLRKPAVDFLDLAKWGCYSNADLIEIVKSRIKPKELIVKGTLGKPHNGIKIKINRHSNRTMTIQQNDNNVLRKTVLLKSGDRLKVVIENLEVEAGWK